MSLFELVINERNGEHEYTHYALFEAADLQQAEEKAHEYCSTFIAGACDRVWDDDAFIFYFECGAIAIEINMVRPTTKEQWMEDCYRRAFQVL